MEFVIEDTGIGIPEEKLQSIFSPFVQANTDTTRKYGGTGLGLSICKNLIEMQGGELWVESKINKGSSFRFILPYKKHIAPVAEPVAQASVNYAALGKQRVLVAEDVELNQFLAKHIMQAWGFEVTIAVNGRKAVEALQENEFDLVLMDIQMPEMDGISATQYIRRLPDSKKAQIPIIALTANALKGDSDTYRQAGMNDYLSKPFTEAGLLTIIQRNLAPNTAGPAAPPKQQAAPIQSPGDIPQESLYDLSMVRAVSGGDEAFIKKMVLLFIETVPPGVQDLHEALQQQDWVRLGKIAHKLKSTVDSMGITLIKDDIRLVENNGKHATDTEQLGPVVSRIATVIQQCIAQLQIDFSI